MDVKAEKEHLRGSIQERLARMSSKDRAAESRSLCRRIREALPPQPGAIAGFVPMPTEPDIRPLLQELLDEGWTVYLPAFERNRLAFRRAASFEGLPIGPLKIPEPPPEAEALDPKNLTIALVPARAFDRSGNRMGRGNGGYDVWVRAQRAANSGTAFWGVCFECQLANAVPMEAHDERVDAVFTARGRL